MKEFYAFAKRDYGEFVAARLKAVLRAAEETWRPSRCGVSESGTESGRHDLAFRTDELDWMHWESSRASRMPMLKNY